MKRTVILIFLAFGFFVPGLTAQEIKLVAMDTFKPFVIPVSKTETTGIAVTVVEKLFSEAKIDVAPVQTYPLKRMLSIVETNPKTFGFALFRNPKREKIYRYIVPVTLPIRSVLVKLKSRTDISVKSIDDAKKYKIGTVSGNNLETLLKKAGCTQIEGVRNHAMNYQKLFAGRISLLASREPALLTGLKQEGFSVDDIEIAFALDEGKPAWLFTNKETPDDIVEKLTKAYEAIK